MNYHAFDSLQPLLQHWHLLRATQMLLFLDALEELIPKTKRSLFGIEQFIKQLQKGGKLYGIVIYD